MWTFPPYNLDMLQARARARLLALGENPQDRLKIYALVAVLRAEELRESRSQGHPRQPQVGVKPGPRSIPEATSARIGVRTT